MGDNTTGAPRQYLGKVKAAEALDLSPNGLWWQRNNAEGWYRRAAEAGDHDAAVVLGVLLHARGEFAEAEACLEGAAAAGHNEAEHVLDDADGPWTVPLRLGRIQDARAGEQPPSIPPQPAIVIQERKKGYPGWREEDLQQRDQASPVRIAQPETWIGVTAVADLLNRSHERVRALAKTPEFPPKAGELKEAKLVRPGWRVNAIQSYAQHRNTQPGQAGWRSRRQPLATRQDPDHAPGPTVR